MATFLELVTSRRAWIEHELKPWCRAAGRSDLLLAEQEWLNLAGKVDPEGTLWAWAWSRFPDLVNVDLGRIDEAHELTVTLRDGTTHTGYPDSRRSKQGELLLVGISAGRSRQTIDAGPFSLDDIATLRRTSPVDETAATQGTWSGVITNPNLQE